VSELFRLAVDSTGAEAYDGPMTQTITPSAEERKNIPNGEHYDQFTVVNEYGDDNFYPVRPGIVGTYTTNEFGYLIQKTEEGFRWIAVEAGETDDFGPYFATRKAAMQDARSSWHGYGGKDSAWPWAMELAKDAIAPERVEADALVELISSEVGTELSAEKTASLAAKIAELVNSAA